MLHGGDNFSLLLDDLWYTLLELLLAIQDLIKLFSILNSVHVRLLEVLKDDTLVEITVLHRGIQAFQSFVDCLLVLLHVFSEGFVAAHAVYVLVE